MPVHFTVLESMKIRKHISPFRALIVVWLLIAAPLLVAWSLYVLHQLVGEERFRQIIRTFFSEFRDKPADFKDFQQVVERVSHKDLGKYFDEWISGAESSRLLVEKVPIEEIVCRYP